MATKQKRTAGQPPFVPNYELLAKIAVLFPTDAEIAVVLGCSRQTIAKLKNSDERYQKVINDAQQNSKMKLRQLQYQQAMDGNTTMSIFLGKQKLDQADTQKHIGDPEQPVITSRIELSPEQMTAAIKALKSETE